MPNLILVRAGRKAEIDSPINYAYDCTEVATWRQVESEVEGVSLAAFQQTGFWQLVDVTEPFNDISGQTSGPLDYYSYPLAPGVTDYEAPHIPVEVP